MMPEKGKLAVPVEVSEEMLVESLELIKRKIQVIDSRLIYLRTAKRIAAPTEFFDGINSMNMDGLLSLMGTLQAEERDLIAAEKANMTRHGVRSDEPARQAPGR